MRRLEPIARDLGRILKALSGMVFVSLIVSVIWGEYYAVPALTLSGLVPLGLGYALTTRYPEPENLGKLHGMMIAASGWLFVGLFGSLPFYLVAWTVAADSYGGLLAVPTTMDTPTLAAFRDPLNASLSQCRESQGRASQ